MTSMRVKSRESRVESRRPVRSRLALRTRRLTSRPPTSRPLPARGLTLIELLVVIIILTTLVSAAIPIMSPDERRPPAPRGQPRRQHVHHRRPDEGDPAPAAVRRRHQAALARHEHRRPTRSTTTTPSRVELFYVEQPAPYRGFDRTSSAMVARHPTSCQIGQVLIQFVTRGTSEPNDDLARRLGRSTCFPPA